MRTVSAQDLAIQNAQGLKLLVVAESPSPAVRIVLPGRATSDRTIEVLFPEHVTAVRHGRTGAEQLYMFSRRLTDDRLPWRRIASSLEYERELPGAIHLLARATLEEDGVRFHYEFTNGSAVAYDMIYAVTDPRLTSIFTIRASSVRTCIMLTASICLPRSRQAG
jgi:hypothetical protein